MPIIFCIVMIKNVFYRTVLLVACSFSLVCCGGGGGGGSSDATASVEAGNLIPETASNFKLQANLQNCRIDFLCDNILFKHPHKEGACVTNCSGSISSESQVTFEVRDSEDKVGGTYSNVAGQWDVSFSGGHYTLTFYNLKSNSRTIGAITLKFKASSVTETKEHRVVAGNVTDGEVRVEGMSDSMNRLFGSATITTHSVATKQ